MKEHWNTSLSFRQAKAGIVMNLLAVIVLIICVNTYGVPMFDLKTFPNWAGNAAKATTGGRSGIGANVTVVCSNVTTALQLHVIIACVRMFHDNAIRDKNCSCEDKEISFLRNPMLITIFEIRGSSVCSFVLFRLCLCEIANWVILLM